MRKLFTILCVLLFAAGLRAQPFSYSLSHQGAAALQGIGSGGGGGGGSITNGVYADLYTGFENGSSNNLITVAILTNASSVGSGGTWALSGTITQMRVNTNQFQMATQAIVLDIGYPDTNGSTRGLSISNVVSGEYSKYTFPSNVTTASCSVDWMMQSFNGAFFNINPIDISGAGSFAALTITDGGTPSASLETDSGDAIAYPISAGVWYHVTIQYVQNSTCTMSIYTNGVQMMTTNRTTGNNPCNLVRFGRVDSHGSDLPATQMFFDNLRVDWTTARFPLGPAANSNYWAPTITSVSSGTPTTTATTITWNTANAWSDTTVYYSTDSSYSSSATGTVGLSHSVALSGLTAGTLYNYKVVSGTNNIFTTNGPSSFTTVATSASDSFTRANETGLASPWLKSGNQSPSFNLSGNAVVPNSLGADTQYYYSGIAVGSNQYAKAKLTVTGTGGGTGPGVGVRMANNGVVMNGVRGTVNKAGASNFEMGFWQTNSGTYFTLTNKTISWVDGTELQVCATNNIYTVFTNSVQILTLTTNLGLTGTNVGIVYSSTDSAATIDDWSAAPYSP